MAQVGRKPRLGRMLLKDPDAMPSPEEALALLSNPAAWLPMSVCMNPNCIRPCRWRAGKGAQRAFCSDSCRRTHREARRLLLAEVDGIIRSLDTPDLDPETARGLRTHLYKRRWTLARYPEVLEALIPEDAPGK